MRARTQSVDEREIKIGGRWTVVDTEDALKFWDFDDGANVQTAQIISQCLPHTQIIEDQEVDSDTLVEIFLYCNILGRRGVCHLLAGFQPRWKVSKRHCEACTHPHLC